MPQPKAKRNCYVWEHSEIIFGPATLESCNRFLEGYIADTAPELKPGSQAYKAHELKYYTVGKKDGSAL